MEQLLLATKIAFANSFAFYLKAANYHWNVEGMFFVQLHELFGKIYEEVQGDLDRFAEEIRALDSYAPASFSRLGELSAIEDETKVPPATIMLERLLVDNEQVYNSLEQAFDFANRANLQGLANFLAERMDAHKKHGWMLRSTLKSR
jgi:starvation-inducible DNA-binding protein